MKIDNYVKNSCNRCVYYHRNPLQDDNGDIWSCANMDSEYCGEVRMYSDSCDNFLNKFAQDDDDLDLSW